MNNSGIAANLLKRAIDNSGIDDTTLIVVRIEGLPSEDGSAKE